MAPAPSSIWKEASTFSFTNLGSGLLHLCSCTTRTFKLAWWKLFAIARTEIGHLEGGGGDPSGVSSGRTHHKYQAPTAITCFTSKLGFIGIGLESARIRCSSMIEPERSINFASSAISSIPSQSHNSFACVQSKSRWRTSSASWWQIGHEPLVPTCLLVSMDLRGIIPWSARQQKIWILRGTCSFHSVGHTSGKFDSVGRANTFACA